MPRAKGIKPDRIIGIIRSEYGMKSRVAEACGLTRAAMTGWVRVPAVHVKTVAKLLGIAPEVIRPDIFADREPRKKKGKK